MTNLKSECLGVGIMKFGVKKSWSKFCCKAKALVLGKNSFFCIQCDHMPHTPQKVAGPLEESPVEGTKLTWLVLLTMKDEYWVVIVKMIDWYKYRDAKKGDCSGSGKLLALLAPWYLSILAEHYLGL